MNNSVTSAVLCCAALTWSLGCAQVNGTNAPAADAGPSMPGGGSGGASGTDSGAGPGTDSGTFPQGTGGSGRGTLEADAGPPPVCGLFHATLEKQPPDVLVLLDRSGSMTEQVL